MTLPLDKHRWWREPMVWLIVALPLSAVVAGIATVVIAARSADTLVQGDYQKEGLALHQNTERDRLAAELGLSASLSRSEDASLRLALAGRLHPLPPRLTMLLTHPTQAERDLDLVMAHQGGGLYLSDSAQDTAGVDWQVSVEPPDHSWRLAGRWPAQQGEALRLDADSTVLSTRP